MSRTSSSLAATPSRPSRQRGALRFAPLFALVGALLFGAAQAQDVLNAVLSRGGSLATQSLVAGDGFRELSLVNLTGETNVFTVYRLNDHADLDAFMAANEALAEAQASNRGAHDAIEELSSTATALSGVSVSRQSTKTMIVDLERGTYVVAAVPKAGGEVSYSTFQVLGGGGEAAEGPQVARTVDFSDFAFDFPTEVDSGITLWKVSNTGTQPHVADLYRLLPGRTAEDLIAYLSGDGGARAPYDETANIAMVAAGQTVYVPVDLKAGNWVAVCFVPDMDDPRLTHVMEGMVSEFRVF